MNESADRPRDNEPEEPGAPEDAELLMRSEPLDTDDGGQVVISQQNVGPDNEVGGGEFPAVHSPTSAEDAAKEQRRLDEEYEQSRRQRER